jgi:alpha-glucosidase (family GH31 glycosyl hydrolase)
MLGKFPEHIYQYTFGDELLLAPVYERGATTQKVFLPEGKWINYWTDELLDGNTEYFVAAPIHQIPLFVKQGSVIPMRKYASSIKKGNNDTLYLHIYPGDNGLFKLMEDDGISNDYLKDIYAFTLIVMKYSSKKIDLRINPVEGHYTNMSSSRKWLLNIHSSKTPKKIKLNKQNLPFKFDNKKKIVIAETPQSSVNTVLNFEIRY